MHGWVAAVLNLLGMGGGPATAAAPPNILDWDVYASPGPLALDLTASRTVSEDLTVSRALDFDES